MTLVICLLGDFTLELDGRPLSLGSQKAEVLFAYLVMQARPLPRETLATLFWNDSDPDQAMANLRKLLSHLRQSLAPYLQFERQLVEFNRHTDYWLDVAEFARLMQPAAPISQMHTAVALYHDHFLAGSQLADAPDVEAWLTLERERYRRLFADGLRALAQFNLQERQYETGIVHARRLLRLDPLSEFAHRQLMLLLARNGQTPAAIAHYHTCRHMLAAELGVEPTPATTALFMRLETAVAHPADLPMPTDSFIGREAERAHIHQMLNDPACRLLTLLGPGGIGKTRLALHVAAERAIDYLHGVHFVSLAAVDSPHALVTAVADALSLSLAGPAPPAQQLLAALQTRELLLVLDNCETLFLPETVAAIQVLTALLQHAPQVQLIATSRERFNLQAEQALSLAGLPYPAANAEPTTDSPAVRLFAERAKTAVPTFTLTPANLPSVVHICRLLQGIPLALELATALLPRHGRGHEEGPDVAALAAAIAYNLDCLAGGDGRADRHASLRAVFESSWGQLLPEEQAVLGRLSIFRSSFTAETAVAVAQAGYQELLGLVDKSFLRLGEDGRYYLHEVLRHYAAERVPDAEAAVTASRHAEYLCHLLAVQGAALNGPQVGSAQAIIQHELENARQAWRWAIQQQQWSPVSRALPGLARYYQLHGPFAEGIALFEWAILALRQATDREMWSDLGAECHVQTAVLHNEQAAYDQAITHARTALELNINDTAVSLAAHVEIGRAMVGQGQYDTAVPLLQDTLTTLQQLPAGAIALARCQMLMADIWRACGMAAHYQGQYRLAHELFSQAVTLARQMENRWVESGLLNNLGVVSKTLGDLAAARVYYEMNLSLTTQIGDRRGQSKTLINLGSVLRMLGHLAGARAVYEEALRLKRDIGDPQGEGLALNNLGNVATAMGDYAGAQAYFDQALHLFRSIGRRRDEGMALSNLGLLAHLCGDEATAVRHSQTALDIARPIGDRSTEAYALTHWGHGLLAQGNLAAAAAAYEQSLSLRQAMGETLMALESQAGLAQVRLAEGNMAAAIILMEPIVPYLENEETGVGEQPFQVYLTCYQVLQAVGDGRAAAILQHAHHLLHKQAAQLEDAPTRHTFLHQVDAHQEIMTAVQTTPHT